MRVILQRYDRQIRRLCRRKAKMERPNVEFSGAKEWSDKELARLDPTWAHRFVLAHQIRKQVFHGVMAVSLLMTAVVFAMSVQRFMDYTPEMENPPKLVSISVWKAYCVVNPWAKHCKPVKPRI